MARHWIPWMLAFFLLMLPSSAIFPRQLSGVDMPEAMETEAGPLVLNGIGQRSVFAQSVYIAGLYLPEPEKNWREVVERDEPMAIRLHVTDAFFASSERMRDAFSKGFRNTMPDGDISPIRDKAEDFIDCFEGRLHTHDEFVIQYIPEKGTRVLKNGKSKGPSFITPFW